jgi:signal transduction histidine kinase
MQENLARLNLGSMLASLLVRDQSPGLRASLAYRGGGGREEEITVVLADEAGAETDDLVTETAPPHAAEHDRADTRLVDFIAHELRNPLSIIRGLSQIIGSRYEAISPEERAQTLKEIEEEADRALVIVESLLKLAETRTKPRPAPERVPVHAILRQVVSAHRQHNPSRTFELTGDHQTFAIANASWLQLALGNLLSNAEKYSPKGKEIQIDSRQVGSRATVMVLDRGAPLPPDRYLRLWHVYGSSPDPGLLVSGTGIGLALCKQLVEGMGGRVWAGPRPEGGNAFSVSLPAPWDPSLPEPSGTVLAGRPDPESWTFQDLSNWN